MTERNPTHVQFSDRAVADALTIRADPGMSRGQVAERDLGRLYALIDRELYRLNIAEPEAVALYTMGLSTAWDITGIRQLWAAWEDARAVGELPECDVFAFGHVLRTLSPLQALAVVDALERARNRPDDEPIGERLRAVGLVR